MRESAGQQGQAHEFSHSTTDSRRGVYARRTARRRRDHRHPDRAAAARRAGRPRGGAPQPVHRSISRISRSRRSTSNRRAATSLPRHRTATASRPRASKPPLATHNGISLLLPYFEQGNKFQQIDFDWDWDDTTRSRNEVNTKQDLGGILICPSSPIVQKDRHATDYCAANRVDVDPAPRASRRS